MKKIQRVEQILIQLHRKYEQGVPAQAVAQELMLDRSTASRYLNQLVKENKAQKKIGRPVRYIPVPPVPQMDKPSPVSSAKTPLHSGEPEFVSFAAGVGKSLQPVLHEAMAALLYPPYGLPILLTGETGVGKSYLAHTLYQIAVRDRRLPSSSPFISFNCAEYAQNPELLMAQLFGVEKGAFTGALTDKAGLVERANEGILFLDEIHRLPPAGQEMLFYLIDQGSYRRLGETGTHRKGNIHLIGATTESPEKVLLPALYRRFSVRLTLPPLRDRPREEREDLLQFFLEQEAGKMGVPLQMSPECYTAFLQYECPGNIGQLRSDIQIACARAFLRHLYRPGQEVMVQFADLPRSLREYRPVTTAIRPLVSTEGLPGTTETEELENIYQQCTKHREQLLKQNASSMQIDQELQAIINQYIHSLLDSADRSRQNGHQEGSPIWSKLFEALRKSIQEIGKPLSYRQLAALSLHIQEFLNKSPSSLQTDPLPSLPEPPAFYHQAAQKIANDLRTELGIDLPAREIKIISLFLSAEEKRENQLKQRLIATVCLTGEGAAVSLEYWLKENLPPTDQDVVVQSVQIDPVNRHSLTLEHLKEEYNLIAVVGTVPPAMDDIFYIPAWELYQPQGFQRLTERLDTTRPRKTNKEEAVLSRENIPEWVQQGLLKTVVHFNPWRFMQIVSSEMETFREVFDWDAELEAGCWMHLGVYTDRLLQNRLASGETEEAVSEPNSDPAHLSTAQIFVWEQLLKRLEETFCIQYPPATAREMARFSATVVKAPV
ncbi:sigma 54-interacting transcriptional regulator [Paenactinomyces guangxiensis]|uniref:Sigma 54-interacting transcriptional regulator n=1 Tax=Paenactinomyces guangxiensis TaxID=1490290 RepID=A0A7W1WPU5_9BACL|nr:sigma-54-dependent transcriptional regulator [Paenactinomyces guangxiensis]MBA4493855.1 sigma 54-interacting transcriptional regulator [Paenactinomyces guangxiensis]MBH8591321.1 sigma 54-interacting transcriptional regulator [Paenactinomyces guangxiensis]